MLKVIFEILLAIFILDSIITKLTKGQVSILLTKTIPIIIRILKKIINKFLTFIDKYIYKIPKMSCYGCLKDNCLNRSVKYNKICVGYEEGKQ